MPRNESARTFDSIVRWFRTYHGWDVMLCDANEADFEMSVIRISRSHNPAIRVHILLHEIGHVLTSLEENADKRFPLTEYDKRTKTHMGTVLMDECSAWDQGLKLALDMGFKIDRKAYDRTRGRMLATYAQWICGMTG